jgi:hypothetical protein
VKGRITLERQWPYAEVPPNPGRLERPVERPGLRYADRVTVRSFAGASLAVALALGLWSCGEEGFELAPADAGRTDAPRDGSIDNDAGSRDAPPGSAEAKFFLIEPVHFVLDGTSYSSEPGRVFTAYQPADSNPHMSPLFVFFNGGPGSATIENLFAENTAENTVDPGFTDGAAIARTARPWNLLGNLLYIDARETGFSYDTLADPSDAAARLAGYSDRNFSAAFDAADFVRVVLRFLAAHPALEANPVVLVGESYGGVRAAAMIHDLLHSASLRAPSSAYIDPALADEIDAHFRAITPGLTGAASPEVASRQFGRQVLIEPVVAGAAQFETAGALMNEAGSPLYILGEEIGKPYAPCDCGAECGTAKDCQRAWVIGAGRDPHDIQVTLVAATAQQASIEASLSTAPVLSSALGIDAAEIPFFSADERAGAYRATSLADLPWKPGAEKGLRDALGSLEAWDWYLLGTNPYVEDRTRMGKDMRLSDWGADFLSDLPYVSTFITHAMLDVVVYPPSIPASLASAYPSTVKSIVVDSAPRDGSARPGWFTVTYAVNGGALIPPQKIRFPIYADAGHHVSSAQPVQLEEDVAAWMQQASQKRE